MPKQKGVKEIAVNRKAFHEYFVLERFEAGIELAGTEVKSIRAGQVNMKDSFCIVKDGELWLRSMHISPYEHGNIFNKDPVRARRLLMHKREIRKLYDSVKRDGYALVPLSVYLKDSPRKAGIASSVQKPFRSPVRHQSACLRVFCLAPSAAVLHGSLLMLSTGKIPIWV